MEDDSGCKWQFTAVSLKLIPHPLARLDPDQASQCLLDQALPELCVPASAKRKVIRAIAPHRQAARQSIEALVVEWPESWVQAWIGWLLQTGPAVAASGVVVLFIPTV